MTFSLHPVATFLLSIAIGGFIALLSYCFFVEHYIEKRMMVGRISSKVVDLCANTKSVSDALRENPSKAAGEAVKELYTHHQRKSTDSVVSASRSSATSATGFADEHGAMESNGNFYDKEEIEKALTCGQFGSTRPSDLFLEMWHDALLPLHEDPMAGMVSPSLMGSTGKVPLTVIGVVWDVCRHMSNLIAKAEEEVFLATNYWQASGASRLITDAIYELDRRAGKRGKKVVDEHQMVDPSVYTLEHIGLPHPDKIPNVHLQLMNYHKPALGTFHAKFVVVDRQHGIVSSNNIQENENLEMMTHLEGPIVNSLYDVCLTSWHIALNPPLPSLLQATGLPVQPPPDNDNPNTSNLANLGNIDRLTEMARSNRDRDELSHDPGRPKYDDTIAEEEARMRFSLTPGDGVSTHNQLVANHLNRATGASYKPTAPEPKSDSLFNPFVIHTKHNAFPIALVNRKPAGAPGNTSLEVPQDAAWTSGLRNARRSVFIQTPNLNAKALLPEIIKAVRRGVVVEYWVCLGYNDAGELLPTQGGTNEMIAAQLHHELKDDTAETRARLKIGWYVGKDQVRPIHKRATGRCCHIKVMIVDDQVGIQGNGNQDTQSWYHSFEVNIMIDSKIVCEEWRDALRRNQNTHLYGMGSQEDGLWRDKDGNMAEYAIGKDPGHFAWAKGIFGAVQRVRGVGGF